MVYLGDVVLNNLYIKEGALVSIYSNTFVFCCDIYTIFVGLEFANNSILLLWYRMIWIYPLKFAMGWLVSWILLSLLYRECLKIDNIFSKSNCHHFCRETHIKSAMEKHLLRVDSGHSGWPLRACCSKHKYVDCNSQYCEFKYYIKGYCEYFVVVQAWRTMRRRRRLQRGHVSNRNSNGWSRLKHHCSRVSDDSNKISG